VRGRRRASRGGGRGSRGVEAPRWEAEAHAAMGPAARRGLTSRASASPGRG
jgi:hypothetical protein